MNTHSNVLALSRILDVLRKEIDPYTSVTQVAILLYIAENPGSHVKDIAEVFNIDTGTCSRLINVLGNRMARKSSKGNYQLVEISEDSEDLRKKLVILSPKGRELIKTLSEALSQ